MRSVAVQSERPSLPVPICDRVRAWASADPTRLALDDGKVQLSYEALEKRAARLACRLRAIGAEQERCVGLFLERSADFVVAALAILKSGAAYVPLDPATPSERAAFILEDANAIAVITNAHNAERLSYGTTPIIEIDNGAASAPNGLELPHTYPYALAYVIYTSGSTGEPKGVEITHGNLCNLIDWHVSTFEITREDRGSLVASLGFDAAVWELWPYLTAGASLHIADEATRRSPEMLHDWIIAHRVTVAFVPTLAAERFFEMDWPPETALRILLTGGDMLNKRPPAGLPFTVVNNYGPTECTVVATSSTVQPADSTLAPPIGTAITNTDTLIVDDALRPVPEGEAGELCLAGAHIGRGYRNRPDLTARQFVTYVSSFGDAMRIYRTGDRARRLPDGQIAFLGRIDDQVKIRGYRIEPGEIIARLNECPGVETSTVVVNGTGSDAALVAYVVPSSGSCLDEDSLRKALATYLPDYMIPAFFVAIPAMPVTSNGKLDKSALPQPGIENTLRRESLSGDTPGEHDAIQERIAALVASLLGRSAVAAHENFFMIGGHSMLGVQLVAQIRDTFGVKLSLRQLFMAPTVAELSAAVARQLDPA